MMTDTPTLCTVISCGEQKQSLDDGETVPARELYTSSVHTCKDKFGRHSSHYFIASAKFGLVHHDKELPEYDQQLGNLPTEQKQNWGRKVAEDLLETVDTEQVDAIVFIGGEEYLTWIQYGIDQLRTFPVPLYAPWQSLNTITGSGKGIAWCSDETHWEPNIDGLETADFGEPVVRQN